MVGEDDAVAQILERDRKQVYDTTVQENLETNDSRKKWSEWMNLVMGEASPEVKAKSEQEQEKMAAWMETVSFAEDRKMIDVFVIIRQTRHGLKNLFLILHIHRTLRKASYTVDVMT